jgi:hypothetical protein
VSLGRARTSSSPSFAFVLKIMKRLKRGSIILSPSGARGVWAPPVPMLDPPLTYRFWTQGKHRSEIEKECVHVCCVVYNILIYIYEYMIHTLIVYDRIQVGTRGDKDVQKNLFRKLMMMSSRAERCLVKKLWHFGKSTSAKQRGKLINMALNHLVIKVISRCDADIMP